MTSAANAFAAPEITPAQAYQAQNPAGHQCEFRGCIFANNNFITSEVNLDAVDVFTDTGLMTNNATTRALPLLRSRASPAAR